MAVTYERVSDRAFTAKNFLYDILKYKDDENQLRQVIENEFVPEKIDDKELQRVQKKLHKTDQARVESGGVLEYICALNPPPPPMKNKSLGTNPPNPWQ